MTGGVKTYVKRGRPTAVHKMADGTKIVGLMRLKDGRWRASGPEKYTFSERDERLAVAHFRRWEATRRGDVVRLPVMTSVSLRQATNEQCNAVLAPRVETEVAEDGSAVSTRAVFPDAVWTWVRQQIIQNPKRVAELVGIEQIGYLRDLRPPEPLPTFEQMEAAWREHCRASDEQRRKVLHDWRDFVAGTGIRTLTDVTPDVVIAYRDAVYARRVSGKSQQNLFTRIRRLVSFARSRAIAVQECGRVLQCLSLLVPSESTISLDPKPVAVRDWRKLLRAATGDDRAMLLLMLNCGMYLAEAVALRWTDVKDDVLIAHRAKTDRVVRVATLWPATRAALAAVPRRGDYVFVAAHGGALGVKGAEKRWRALRKSAGVTGVTSSQIRDGAATAAAEAGVEPMVINLLLGHRSGINDHYVKRRPQMVAPACAAVEKAYFG